MPYDRGQIVLALFPDSYLRTTKRRPALVVQADNLGTGLSQIIVAMISTNLARAGHPSRFSILRSTPEGRRAGLLHDSVIMTDNLATIRESEIHRALGVCTKMSSIDVALRVTLGL